MLVNVAAGFYVEDKGLVSGIALLESKEMPDLNDIGEPVGLLTSYPARSFAETHRVESLDSLLDRRVG